MNDSYLMYLKDQFSCLGPISIRKMFGGAGIYLDGIMFGIVSDDRIYLKVDDSNKHDYENEGMSPFTYEGKKGKPITLSYYQLPEDVLDDIDNLVIWGQKSVHVSQKKGRA